MLVDDPPLSVLADPGRSLQDIPNRLVEILLRPHGPPGLDRGLAAENHNHLVRSFLGTMASP